MKINERTVQANSYSTGRTGFEPAHRHQRNTRRTDAVDADTITITEEARRRFRERNASPLVKTLSVIVDNSSETAAASEQGYDSARRDEVRELVDRVKNDLYEFSNSRVMDITGERILDLLRG